MFSEDVKLFNDTIAAHYEEYKRKLKQFCFLNGITWDEDTMNDTYVKCVDLISRKGLQNKTERGALDYFFQAFKKNTFQEHYQRNKIGKDDNVDVYTLEIADINLIEEEEERAWMNTMNTNYILQRVREEFDEVGYHIFRLRYLFAKDGKQLTFKEIKRLTKVESTRTRLLTMNEFIKTVVKKEIETKCDKYTQHLKQYM